MDYMQMYNLKNKVASHCRRRRRDWRRDREGLWKLRIAVLPSMRQREQPSPVIEELRRLGADCELFYADVTNAQKAQNACNGCAEKV